MNENISEKPAQLLFPLIRGWFVIDIVSDRLHDKTISWKGVTEWMWDFASQQFMFESFHHSNTNYGFVSEGAALTALKTR